LVQARAHPIDFTADCLHLSCHVMVALWARLLSVAVAFAALTIGVGADLLPMFQTPLCSTACADDCTGGTQKCCPGGNPACSSHACGEHEVSLPSFACAASPGHAAASAEDMRCCVPRCSTDGDCPEGEVCGGLSTGYTCRRPTCADLGGTCRFPTGADPEACQENEAEHVFQERCDSGCGYWRGRCGQTCCVEGSKIAPASAPKATGLAAAATEPAAAFRTSGSSDGGSDVGSASPALRLAEVASLGLVASIAIFLWRRASPGEGSARAVPGMAQSPSGGWAGSGPGRSTDEPCE